MALFKSVYVLISLASLASGLAILRAGDLFSLNVVHVNDFHARFEETNEDSGACKTDEKCIGGFSRLYSAINGAIAAKPDSIVLNGGDNYQGTLWYNIFKWNVTQYFMNKIPFDAIVLGNHEFDDGIQGVVPFIKSSKAPIITANIDDSLEPDIQGTYKKSVVIERNGKKIGIIGVIIKSTDEMSKTEKLKFLDESETVNAEAQRLVNEEGVFTNIVLSHCGYDIDQDMAAKATANTKIGLIVGGHSHSFLYSNESSPGPDTPAGPYPTVVPRTDGNNVLVVQASAYAKYVGNITVIYDENGNVVDFSGAPLFLDTDMPQDEAINQELAPWKEGVDAQGNRILGTSQVTLDKSTCYYAECLLGNFVTDVMVYNYLGMADENSWTYAAMAITNAGGLRTTIQSGNVTYNDMITAQPFGNTFDVGEIEGKYIKEMFEFTTEVYHYGRAYVDLHLLQVSGIHVVYNLTQPVGSRVQSIKVRCNECKIPIYEDLDVTKTYRLIVPSFIRGGGDGYHMVEENLKNVIVGSVDIDVFVDYFEHKSPIYQEIEGRIEIIGGEKVTFKNIGP